MTDPVPQTYVPQTFYVSEFDQSNNAMLAQITGGATTILPSYDDRIEFEIDASCVQSFFRFISNSVDISDNVSDDILFRHVQQFKSSEPLGENFMVRDKCISTLLYTAYQNKSLPDNYERYLALRLFNTEKGVDLFSNEAAVREDLRSGIVAALHAKLASICAYNDASLNTMEDTVNNPARTIFRQLLAADTSRFDLLHIVPDSDTSELTVAENGVECYMPFIVGDQICFVVTVVADPHQGAIINSDVVIDPRRYLLVANVVNKTTDAWESAAYKTLMTSQFNSAKAAAVLAKSDLLKADGLLQAAITARDAAINANDGSATKVATMVAAKAAYEAKSNDWNLKTANLQQLKEKAIAAALATGLGSQDLVSALTSAIAAAIASV